MCCSQISSANNCSLQQPPANHLGPNTARRELHRSGQPAARTSTTNEWLKDSLNDNLFTKKMTGLLTGNALVSINKVALHQVRLILRYNHFYVGKPPQYATSYPGKLNLAIPSWNTYNTEKDTMVAWRCIPFCSEEWNRLSDTCLNSFNPSRW